jgi:hypothetical protein
MLRRLHTWERNLPYHPHVHCVVPGGGVAEDGGWLPSRANFIFPVKAFSDLLPTRFRDRLHQPTPEILPRYRRRSVKRNG